MTQTPPAGAPAAGALLDFAAGTVIFNEGDPGGDLFFIKAGDVEVYKSKDGVEVTLATLHAGEVLGIMTCLTREPRLASARAQTDVKALIVKQAGIRSLIQSTPPWVSSVIKDFTLRVKNIDQLYWQAVVDRGGAHGLSSVQLTATLLNGLAELGSFAAYTADGDAGAENAPISVDRGIKHLSRILDISVAKLEACLKPAFDSGILKLQGEGERRAPLTLLQRVAAHFAAAVQCFQIETKTRRAADALTSQDIATLLVASGSCVERGMRPDEEASTKVSLLAEDSHALGVVRQALGRAQDAGVVALSGEGEDQSVAFAPAVLAARMRALLCIRQLREIDRIEEELAEKNRQVEREKGVSAIRVITESF